MNLPIFYFVLLAFLWFLFYWIVGGAFFALIAVFRLGRLNKGRFSCLFSLFALFSAFGAAYFGSHWGAGSAQECIAVAETNIEGFVAFFGCSIVAVMLSFILGAAAVLLLGALSLIASSAKPAVPKNRDPKDSDRNPSALS